MPDITILRVLLYGRKIGTLTLLPGERILFVFSQDYIDDPNRPILSLSFKDQMGELITDIRPTRIRVPPFFSNLLPEGSMRDYLAGRAGVNGKREFFLLWVLGRDLPGGITIEPDEHGAWPPGDNGGGKQGRDGPQTALRFSLAGVQLKFSAVMEATGGLTIPAEGVGGSWIIKLPSMKFDAVPENEFAMMSLARMTGIDVPEVQLVDLDSIAGLPDGIGRLKGSALAVKRFDRTDDGEVIHIEDFAQVFGVYPEKKYDRASYRNIAEVLWAEIGAKGIEEFIRRLVFNTLIGNADMHLKNWSLIYPDRRHAVLSPGYDFVSTIAYIDDKNMALNFLKSKSMTDLSIDTLTRFAAKARLPEKLVLDTGMDTTEKFMYIWENERNNLTLSGHMIETIEQHLMKIELAGETTP
ncbi:MAG TPA: type II toxin-antitoxin system HipA family toxin [Acidiferrobacteraceae bacterium]|nr:type II toxin-antitoxin system HipA family toxin [Acidiferrobacteraceae bacterium]